MSTTLQYPHLTIDDDGIARVSRTRYKVSGLAAEHFHYGWTAEELLRQHPDLRPEEVYAALTYFYDHAEQILSAIEAAAAHAEEQAESQRLSRAELLQRRAACGD
ncbi:MAG: DUF433 domain-containing protein [Planctomycetaceae bacterium]